MYFRIESTKANLPEYFLRHSINFENLKKILTTAGYIMNKDWETIYWRGYDMKATIRFNKSKMKKNELEVVELIKDFLLTEEIYNKSSDTDKMYYNIKKYFK